MAEDAPSILEARGSSPSLSEDELADTRSIDSSITKYRMENGRRYHAYKDGIYWAPNDEKQNDNLDISHHKYLLLLNGKLTLAPLSKDIERVLDVGTGTGIWAIDFADEYPNAEIIGTDLSPIQPEHVPPNCRFEIDDARDRWLYLNHFDFIHIRALFGSIDDWPTLYRQALKHLKPGGYLEQVEISIKFKSDDGTMKQDSCMNQFTNLYLEAERMTGQTFMVFDVMTRNIEEAGFVNVVERVYKVAMNGWPADLKARELGHWTLLGFDVGLEGYAMATLTRVLGWSRTEVYVFLAKLRAECRDRRCHSYHEIKVVTAQKPPASQ